MPEKNTSDHKKEVVILINSLILLHLNELIFYCLTMFTKKVKIKIKFENSFVNNCPSHLEMGYLAHLDLEANLKPVSYRYGSEKNI